MMQIFEPGTKSRDTVSGAYPRCRPLGHGIYESVPSADSRVLSITHIECSEKQDIVQI